MAWLTLREADRAVIREIERGPDRAATIVGAAYLEERLTQTLRSAFEKNDDLANRLFRGYGPLGSFAAKIDLAFMMGMLPDQLRRQMHTLREIRNEFAHTAQKVSFKTQRVRDLCKNLPPPTQRRDAIRLTPEEARELLTMPAAEKGLIAGAFSASIYAGLDTPRRRCIILIKSSLLHLELILRIVELKRKLCEENPIPGRTYWPWPSLSRSVWPSEGQSNLKRRSLKGRAVRSK